MSTITPLSSIPGLGSSTSHQGGQKQHHGALKGELLKGTVLEARANNSFVLDFGGTKIITHSKTPLTVGQQLQFQVINTPPPGGQALPVESFQNGNALFKAIVVEALPNNRFVLDFNGSKVIAEFKSPLSVGQQLQYQVNVPSQQNPPPFKEALQGQNGLVKATVLEVLPNNRFVLDINGTKVLTESQAPLTAGQPLQLQITGTSPHIQLSIVSNMFSIFSGKSLTLLGNNIDLTGLSIALKQGSPSPFSQLTPATMETLETFLPAKFHSLITSKENGEFIQNLFNRLGISLETLLSKGNIKTVQNTLKASLFEIIQRFQGSDQITEQATKQLATLEIFQFAQLQLNQQNSLIFPLPFPFLEQGYLLIEDYDTKKDQLFDEDADLHYSLHLAMSGLGNMKIDFLQKKEDLFIRINVDSKEKADFLSSFLETLNNKLTVNSVISMTVSHIESPANELAKKLLPQGKSILNTSA